jgi:hypothetical protein
MNPIQYAENLKEIITGAEPRLRLLAEEEVSRRPAPGKWSKKEILGHLIDSAANNHHRLVRVQQSNPLRFHEYNQDEWVRIQKYEQVSWEELISFWVHYSMHIARIIGNYPIEITESRWLKEDGTEIRILALLDHYLWHTEHHLGQIFSE